MPGVVRTTPQTLTYRTDDGQEHEVARGYIPELDYEADAFEQQMGGASAGPMMADARLVAPPANVATDAMAAGWGNPAADQAYRAPQDSSAFNPAAWGGAPGSSPARQQQRDNFAGLGAPPEQAQEAARWNQEPAPEPPTPEQQARAQAQAEGARPGRMFQGAGAPAPAQAPQGEILGSYVRGGGGPGGPRTTSRMTRALAAPIDPSYGEEIGQAALDMDLARTDAQMVAEERAKREAVIRGQAERDMAAAMQGQQQAQERYQQRVAEQRAKIDADMERYQRVSEDPFAEKSTDAKITAMIGMALMGLGSAIAGTENKAMDVLNAQIERELAASREKIRAGQGRLAELRDDLGSEQAAIEAHKAGIYQRLTARLESLVPEMADQEMASRARAMAAEARMASAQAAAQAAQAAAGTGEMVIEQRAGGPGGRGRQMQLVRLPNGLVTEVDVSNARDALAVDERLGQRPPEGEAVVPADLRRISDAEAASTREREAIQDILSRVGPGDDVPGIGPIEGRLPDALVGRSGRETRAQARNVAIGIIRRVSGASFTPAEMEQELESRGLSMTAPESEFVGALRRLEAESAANMATVRSGANAATVRAYDERMRQEAARAGQPLTAGAPVVRGR